MRRVPIACFVKVELSWPQLDSEDRNAAFRKENGHQVMFDLVGKVLNESYLVREYIESPL